MMTPENFVYWLQGFFEIDGAEEDQREGLSAKQVDMIKRHLGYVLDRKHPQAVKPTNLQKQIVDLFGPADTTRIC